MVVDPGISPEEDPVAPAEAGRLVGVGVGEERVPPVEDAEVEEATVGAIRAPKPVALVRKACGIRAS